MNTKKISIVVCLLLVCFVLQAQQFSRVVSLSPSLTKTIYFLQAQESLVGCTSYCIEGIADNKSVVASPVTINVERVVGLKPDLVIATTITNPKYIEMLRKFDFRVEVLPTPGSFNEICEQFVYVGDLFGLEDSAVNMVSAIRSELRKLQSARDFDSNKKIFFQIGADPLYAVTADSFMNDYILFAGAQNIAEGFRKGTVSREAIVARNPDYIFIVTMGIIGDDEKRIWQRFNDISAVKNNSIFIIDSDLACTPTPQTFLETMKIVFNYLK